MYICSNDFEWIIRLKYIFEYSYCLLMDNLCYCFLHESIDGVFLCLCANRI